MDNFTPAPLHLVFGVNGSTDDRSAYPPFAVTERHRVATGGGVLGAAEGVPGGILWCGAGLEAAGLGAQHLDNTTSSESNPWGKRSAVGERTGHDQHNSDDGLKYPCTLATGDHGDDP